MNRTPLKDRLVPYLIVLALLACVSSLVLAFPRTVEDGLGNKIYLETPPQRIFSTGLAMDNMLLTLVDPSRVVGVTRFATDPAAGSYVADRVQQHMTLVDALSPELVIAANPDLVLVAVWNDPDAVAQIRLLGYPVYTFTKFDSVADALENLLTLGRLTGEESTAERLVSEFERRALEVQQRIGEAPAPRVLYYNSWGSTVGSGTTMDDIIRYAGGVNVISALGIDGWPQIDFELIIQTNPDVIITDSGPQFVERLLNDPLLSTVNAVQSGRVYNLEHTDALDHRLILPIEQLARLLHPDAFRGDPQ